MTRRTLALSSTSILMQTQRSETKKLKDKIWKNTIISCVGRWWSYPYLSFGGGRKAMEPWDSRTMPASTFLVVLTLLISVIISSLIFLICQYPYLYFLLGDDLKNHFTCPSFQYYWSGTPQKALSGFVSHKKPHPESVWLSLVPQE